MADKLTRAELLRYCVRIAIEEDEDDRDNTIHNLRTDLEALGYIKRNPETLGMEPVKEKVKGV